MRVFSAYSYYIYVLFLNEAMCFGFRDNPYLERFRRFRPSIDRDYDSPPYYPDPDWTWLQKRSEQPLEGEEPKQLSEFLDLQWIKDVLNHPYDVLDENTSQEDYSDDPEVETDYFRSDPEDADVPKEEAESDEESDNAVGEYEFRYEVLLDTKGEFVLEWDVDPVTEIIRFRLVAMAAKNDMLLFGFSDYGEVTNADVMVMWTNHNGHHVVQDAHTDPEGNINVDDHQDYKLDDVTIKDGRLSLIFHRKYDTCDDEDYLIDSGTTHIIFYTQAGVLADIDDLDLSDVKVGLQRVQLLKSQLPDPPQPDDTQQFIMHVDKVAIPSDETTYWFAIRKLPDFKTKHHIIQFEGAISPQSEGIVHHMEVFHCDVKPGEVLPHYDAPSNSKSERPEGLEACRQVIGAWAMGAKPLAYPEEAGSPIGGRDFSTYVMLEVHYNNPDHKQGIIDSSGIKFHVTSKLRKYDAGTLEVGLEYSDKMALPPGLPVWLLQGYCVPECTQTALPEGGIKVFASQLHTHLTGRRTYTKHYRDGVELPDLNRDNHYSPHYQEIRKLHRQVTVLPGDALVNVCEDQTTDRDNITLGGFAISDEMCVNYMHYYPKTNLEVCKSSVTTSALYGFFKFLNVYNHQDTSPDLGISDNYKAVDWSPINIKLLRTFYDTTPLSMQCNQSDGSRFPGVDWEGIALPEVTYPRPPEPRPCMI